MRSRGRRLAVAAALIVGLAGVSGSTSAQPGVTIQTFQFTPASIEVPTGGAVEFANGDDIAHTVTSGTPERRDGAFDHRLDGRGASTTVRLTRRGVYPYFCDRHQSMRGEIRVRQLTRDSQKKETAP